AQLPSLPCGVVSALLAACPGLGVAVDQGLAGVLRVARLAPGAFGGDDTKEGCERDSREGVAVAHLVTVTVLHPYSRFNRAELPSTAAASSCAVTALHVVGQSWSVCGAAGLS